MTWLFPRTGSCHEGIPFADGVTGVLVWGGGDTVNLTVGRGDLWDHRGGYPWTEEQSYGHIVSLVRTNDLAGLKALFVNEPPTNWGGRYNPYMLPLGRVVIRLPGRTLASGTLDTSTGLGAIELAEGGRIELAMSASAHRFALRLPQGVSPEVRTVPATDFPIYEKTLKARGFEKAVVTDGADGARGGFEWRLPADPSVRLAWRKEGNEFVLGTARGQAAASADGTFESVRADSVARWTAFWREGARVRVPDPVIQEIFDFGMYKFGSMTDPSGVAAGLQGQWLEDDRLVPWNGDYHFNINVQECYSPAYRGGHFANLMPLFRMVLSWRDRLRDNARKFAKIPDGYVLPHSVDDRGVCIGGFWTGTIDHASTAWVAAMMFRYVKYSGDVAFLKAGAYDFMKGAMNVYLAMMEERDGRLSIPLGPSPEWGAADANKAVGRDPSFQLAAAHRLARDLVAAAALLGEKADPRWLDVERRLPAYANGPGGFQLFEGQPFAESHRHHSHLAGLYPFDTVSRTDARDVATVWKTYETWVCRGTGQWTGWCVPWASALHVHMGLPDAAVQALHAWRTFFNNPGHGSLHDAFRKGYTFFCHRTTIMQMDGQCAAAAAVMELMAHEVDGKTEFFRGCPESWREVSFENLALSDGRRVSGRRRDGKVEIGEVADDRVTVRPEITREALVNPGMGWVHYHYDNSTWNYGYFVEPGDTLDWFPGASVIYFRLPWSALEPEEGKFRWDVIDTYAQSWIAAGKQVAFRFTCSESGCVYATPQWVEKAGAKGRMYRYKGKGRELWEPDFLDPVFLKKLENFLAAAAAKWNGNPALAFIDVGSFGMWGEGHTGYTSKLGTELTHRIALAHAKLYKKHFDRSYVVISDDVARDRQRSDDNVCMQRLRELGVGFRDDSIMVDGRTNHRQFFHDRWARKFAEAGLPVVLEPRHFYAGSDGKTENWYAGGLLESVIANRGSYQGIHGWPRNFLRENRAEIDAVNLRLGYRLELREAGWPRTVRNGSEAVMSAEWANVGVDAPAEDLYVTWSLLDGKGTVRWASVDSSFSLRKLPPALEQGASPRRVTGRVRFGWDEEAMSNPLKSSNLRLHDGTVLKPRNSKVPTVAAGEYDLAVSVGRLDGVPRIALPIAGQIGKTRRYRLGRLTVTESAPR